MRQYISAGYELPSVWSTFVCNNPLQWIQHGVPPHDYDYAQFALDDARSCLFAAAAGTALCNVIGDVGENHVDNQLLFRRVKSVLLIRYCVRNLLHFAPATSTTKYVKPRTISDIHRMVQKEFEELPLLNTKLLCDLFPSCISLEKLSDTLLIFAMSELAVMLDESLSQRYIGLLLLFTFQAAFYNVSAKTFIPERNIGTVNSKPYGTMCA